MDTTQKKTLKLVILVVILALLWLGISSLTNKEQRDVYNGFYYPNGSTNERDWLFSPIYGNLTDCKAWASDIKLQRDSRGINTSSDVAECGLNCEDDESLGLQICDETYDVYGSASLF